MLLLVRMTYGAFLATNVPTSGTEIWNSPSVSSSTASRASSARSTSSISSTTGSSDRIASIRGRSARNCSEKKTLSWLAMRSTDVLMSGASWTISAIFSRSIWV